MTRLCQMFLKPGTKEYREWVYQSLFKGYYRMVASLDENIGRLLDYLKQTGLDKNTIVVYVSDNGFFTGQHGLFNKMWNYEESLKVPLIISHPDFKEQHGTKSDLLVSLMDLGPTIIDLSGGQKTKEMQGASFRKLLEGKKISNWRKYHFYCYFDAYQVPNHYGIKSNRYKLIYYPGAESNAWELYDLKEDAGEMHNLAYDKNYAKLVKDMKLELYKARIEAEHIDDRSILKP